MTDIVEQLRGWCSEIRRHPAPIADAVPMVQQAADEIERLRLIIGDSHPGYVIGMHWMSAAYSRICAGENEAQVMLDYGYHPIADEVIRLRALLNDAASAFKRYAFHDIDCNCSVESAPCDCGYHEVSRQLADRIDAAIGKPCEHSRQADWVGAKGMSVDCGEVIK